MLQCALLCTLLPCCVTGIHFRLPQAPPFRYMSSLDSATNALFGADGVYHDPDAAFEEFGSYTDATPMQPLASPSFCVFSRVIVQELPYVKSFVEHYVHLDVRKFYFVNNLFQQHAIVAKFLETLAADLSIRIALHSVHVTESNAALNDMELFRHIDEDFVVAVDVDEYWMLPDGISSFRSLVEAHPNVTEYRAQWVMVPNDDIDRAAARPYRGFRGANGKWMAKVDRLERIATHKPIFVKELMEYEIMLGAGELIHFWGRSFLDQLTKGLAQHSYNRAGEDLHEVLKMTSEGKVPERLRMLAFLMNLDRNISVDVSADLLQIDYDLEKDIAAELLQSNITSVEEEAEKIHSVYRVFKEHVAKIMSKGEYPTYPDHGLEKIAPWLEKLDEPLPHSD